MSAVRRTEKDIGRSWGVEEVEDEAGKAVQ
jgi:hypothetical protein